MICLFTAMMTGAEGKVAAMENRTSDSSSKSQEEAESRQ
jgi:hypothetical protein